jgi:hypothetical protein
MSTFTRLSLVAALLIAMFGAAVVPIVSAQSTPEADRYVREGQGYAGEFADVFVN